MLNEISQTEIDKYYIMSLVCGDFKSQTQRQGRMVVSRAWREKLVKRYKLL